MSEAKNRDTSDDQVGAQATDVPCDGKSAPTPLAFDQLRSCWCYRCLDAPEFGLHNPVNMQMILCPACGNKRCPRATDHRFACTGSNEAGQFGSNYRKTADRCDGGEDGVHDWVWWCQCCGATETAEQRPNYAQVTEIDPATDDKIEPGTVALRCSCGSVTYHDLVTRPEPAELCASDAPAIVDVPAPLAELVSAATAYREATNAWACEGAERRMFKALDALPTLAARPDYPTNVERAKVIEEAAHWVCTMGPDIEGCSPVTAAKIASALLAWGSK